MSVHPEDFCQQCRRPNIVWFVDSRRWNAAVPDEGILCPQCFVDAYAEATGDKPVWELRRSPNATDDPFPEAS